MSVISKNDNLKLFVKYCYNLQFPCPDGSTGGPCPRNDQDANVLYDNKMLGVPRSEDILESV